MISSAFLSPALALCRAMGPELFRIIFGTVPESREPANSRRVKVVPALVSKPHYPSSETVSKQFRNNPGTIPNPKETLERSRVMVSPVQPWGATRGGVSHD
jgi:hypothetical protein